MRFDVLCSLVTIGVMIGAQSQRTTKEFLLHRYQDTRNRTGGYNVGPTYGSSDRAFYKSSPSIGATSNSRNHVSKSTVSPPHDILKKLQEAHKVIAAGNKFGLALMKYLIAENDNTIMAPVSLSVALGMLYFAAAGNTKSELSRALHYDELGLNSENIVTQTQYLTQAAKANKPQGVSFELGNFIFAQKGLNISNFYRNLVNDVFGGAVENVDFSRPTEAAGQMNQLINSLTKGQISNPIKGLSPATRIVLTNAVYFKGFWKKPFSVRSSFDSTFFNDGVSEVPVKMMYMRDSFLTKSLPDIAVDAIQLPYEGDLTTMLVLLPKDPIGVNRMLQNLNISKLLEDLPTYTNESLDLHIPRFSVRGSYHLKQQLYDLGIRDLFVKGNANLPHLDPDGELVVDDVVHEAKIRVDERGTEAVAVSTAAIINYSRYPSFSVRHPFVFFVIHKHTGSVFFAGKILRINGQ